MAAVHGVYSRVPGETRKDRSIVGNSEPVRCMLANGRGGRLPQVDPDAFEQTDMIFIESDPFAFVG